LRLEERKVDVGDLVVGMYVCRLDREWDGTPFPLQGIAIRSQADIDALAEYCRHVYVDIEMGLAPRDRRSRLGGGRLGDDLEPHEIENLQGKVVYTDTESFDDELPQAQQAREQALERVARILDDVRDGRPISPEDVRSAVEPMVRSIVRNRDAFLWVENLGERSAYEYNHALGCSALAVVFGRHIGFPEALLIDMAAGGLLLDVGKLRVPGELLGRPDPLDVEETAVVRRHVEHALDIVDEGDVLPSHVREMIRTHHERDDGSGYPDRLMGSQIPLLGRIAGVVDSYDAMTSDRSYRRAIDKHAALQQIYRARDHLHQVEIVEQFLQCMSVYPIGTLVELSDGCVAVVLTQNFARRLRPRVLVLTTPDKRIEPAFRSLDLMAQPDGGDERGRIEIVATHAPGAFGLDATEFYL
jgi:HD-GYP domain-containing protein (c-di-GMP phosphodiesterase class II)